ncbi:MAG: LLM class flavin-dependent oxidoreductase [Streptosporangiales bacterium]|nr:LLM class flavin-dependent oxidoreductase [Streptosporangiales bacterium]
MATIEIGTGAPAPDVMDLTYAARFVEELGFESVWMPDLVIGDGTPALEPALALAAAAAATERVRIGFSVLVVPLRPAPWLAVQVATLQQLSGNRLLLGVGTGGFPGAPFWRALGVPGHDRGRITDETLRLLPQLLAGEPTAVVGGEPPLTLAPAVPMPPVLVGGTHRAFRRALDHGAGWFPSLVAPDDLARSVTTLRDLAAERGVPVPEITVGGHMVIGDDTEARSTYDALVRNLVDVHGMPQEQAARTPMRARNAEELGEIFAAYASAGAARIVAGPDNGPWQTQLERVVEARDLLG